MQHTQHTPQVLTLTGNTFTTDEEAVEVVVGGTPCVVLHSTLTTITCRLAKRNATAPLPRLQPGSRGVLQKYFNGYGFPGANHAALSTVRNDAPFLVEVNPDHMDGRVNFDSTYSSEHRAMFRVPRTATYRFLTAGDDPCYVRV